MSGLTADARTLVDHARVEAQATFKSGELFPFRLIGSPITSACPLKAM